MQAHCRLPNHQLLWTLCGHAHLAHHTIHLHPTRPSVFLHALPPIDPYSPPYPCCPWVPSLRGGGTNSNPSGLACFMTPCCLNHSRANSKRMDEIQSFRWPCSPKNKIQTSRWKSSTIEVKAQLVTMCLSSNRTQMAKWISIVVYFTDWA